MQRQISEDVLEFIARRIDSVPHLETLLLLWADSATTWSDEEISRRVYVSRDAAAGLLHDLSRHGLIRMSGDDGRFCYNPEWDEGGLMPKVAESYRRQLVQVSEMIHAKASSGAVREFARAFKFKRED